MASNDARKKETRKERGEKRRVKNDGSENFYLAGSKRG